MPIRKSSVVVGVLCASAGLIAGLGLRRAELAPAPHLVATPATSVASIASIASIAPVATPPTSVAPIATPPTSVAPIATPPTSIALGPTPLPTAPRLAPPVAKPAPRLSEEPITTPRVSPLSAFRFAGIGPGGGLRLARVRPGSLPAALGLLSGDELVSINGFRLSDPEQALTAYARLRYVDRLSLVIQRNGRQTEIAYFVR